jgi:hypothetical protein
MSFGLLRHTVIMRGLRKQGTRKVRGKHAKQQRALSRPQIRQIPKWENCGIMGLKRFE